MFILLLLFLSILAGMLLQKFSVLRWLGQTSVWTVWLLIFVFGISLGSNDAVVNNFGHFGLTALIIALAGVAGSVLAAWGIGRYIAKNKRP